MNEMLGRIDDEELTRIYNAANGLDQKRHNPITTERIFTAMRAAMAAEREACAKKLPDVLFDGYSVMQQLDKRGQARTSQDNVSDVLDAVVRIMRSNDGVTGA